MTDFLFSGIPLMVGGWLVVCVAVLYSFHRGWWGVE